MSSGSSSSAAQASGYKKSAPTPFPSLLAYGDLLSGKKNNGIQISADEKEPRSVETDDEEIEFVGAGNGSRLPLTGVDAETEEGEDDEEATSAAETERKESVITKATVDQRTAPVLPKTSKDKRDANKVGPAVSLSKTFALKNPYAPGPGDITVYIDVKKDDPADHYSKIFLELAEPVKEKVLGREVVYSHLCLLCVELNRPQQRYSQHRHNHKTHLKAAHLNVEYQFMRVKELLHKSVRVFAEQPVSRTIRDMMTEATPVETYKDNLVKALISMGASSSVVEDPDFRVALESARNVASGVPIHMGRADFKQTAIKQLNRLYASFLSATLSENCLGWSIVLDAWDWGKKIKILGATAILLSTAMEYDGLEQHVYPLVFRQLRGESKLDEDADEDLYLPLKTISSADDMAGLFTTRLKEQSKALDLSLSFSKFVGAKGDGASNAVNCSRTLNEKAELLATLKGALPLALETLTETRCIAHALGLAIKGTIGYLEPKEDSEIPPGPSTKLKELFKTLRAIVTRLGEAKVWAQMLDNTNTDSLTDPTVVHLDMEVRWLSFYNMLAAFLDNWDHIQSLRLKNIALPEIDVDKLRTLRELRGILEPLMRATTFLETSSFPTTPFVLPMIYSILSKYGGLAHPAISSIFETSELPTRSMSEQSFLEASINAVEEKTFSVQVTDNGQCEQRKVKSMTSMAKDFAVNLRWHLMYRLIKDRKNANAIDLLAAWCDPVGQTTIEMWCKGSYKKALEVVFDNIRPSSADSSDSEAEGEVEVASSAVSRTSDKAYDPDEEVADAEEEEGRLKAESPTVRKCKRARTTVGATALEEEKLAFADECNEVIKKVLQKPRLSIPALIEAAPQVNPLCFWTEERRVRFPTIYKVATIAASSASHTCLQESIFSSASDTLTSRRRRLLESDDLLEALVVLRYHYNSLKRKKPTKSPVA
jgi:hypothetical protein